MGKAGETEPDVKRILRFEIRKSPEIDGCAAQPTENKPVNSRFSVTKVSEGTQQDQQLGHSSVSANEGKLFPSSNGIATSATNPSDPALNKPITKDSVAIQIDDDFPCEIRPVKAVLRSLFAHILKYVLHDCLFRERNQFRRQRNRSLRKSQQRRSKYPSWNRRLIMPR